MIFRRDDTFACNFAVTEALHDGFIELFGDRNPLHVEDAFATAKGFRSKVMHGNILGGFLSYFIGECLPTKDVIIHSQEIQFKHAVYLYDVLSLVARVDGVYESVNTVEFKFVFRNGDYKIVSKGMFQIGVL
jgi:3-hydroxybutyryl-CoA dehydratase